MSIWIILSWVFVLILTVINVIVFLKLKQATEQMMQMAFPGTKNMGDALAKMQKMTQGMGMGPGMGQGMNRGPKSVAGGSGQMDAQLKAAMDMLQKMQQKGGRR